MGMIMNKWGKISYSDDRFGPLSVKLILTASIVIKLLKDFFSAEGLASLGIDAHRLCQIPKENAVE